MSFALIGLKLLGFGKSIGKFVTNNWKWLLPVLIIIAGYFYVNYKIDAAYDSGYTEGVAYEVSRQQEKIAIENRKNREFEASLSAAITNFGKEVAKETTQRVVKETDLRTRVDTIIHENPVYQECKVDPEVLDARNRIRSLGPLVNTLNMEIDSE